MVRRPTPLPATPVNPAPGAKPARATTAAPVESPAPVYTPRRAEDPVPAEQPARAERPTPGRKPPGQDAPVSLLAGERGGTDSDPSLDDASAAATGSAATDSPPEAEPPTRLRDVWRATRARRKALRSEVRRFTVRARRRRLGWLVAAASVAALLATTLIIAYSPLFAVEKVVIAGAVRMDGEELETAIAGQLGRPLASVDESEIKAALVKFPMVESYQIEARPPHELLVRIVERTPIGVFQGPAGYSLVDAAGVVLGTTPDPPAGTPLLEIAGGTNSAAFSSAGLVMRALPESIRVQVTGVTATTRDDVTLHLGGSSASVVWGSVTDSAEKALVLETAMQQIPPSGIVSYDVSSPGTIVIR